MLLKCLFFIFIVSAIHILELHCEDDFSIDDEEIPVIEGDGGVIKTGVENNVLILTRDNFDIQVNSKDIILVEFYAPWCGHCKSLDPEYAKAAKILKEQEFPIPLAKVDATVEEELARRHDVSGFPTLFIFKKGERIPYEGPRTAMGIVEYMNERANPNWKPPPQSVLTLTKDNFTDLVDSFELILVEFYAPWCGHCKRLEPEFERAARILKDLATPIPLAKVDGTVETDLASTYGASGYPTLLIFRKGVKYPYEGPRDEPGIVAYMKEQAKPPSMLITSVKELEKNMGKIDATIVGFFDDESDPLCVKLHDAANSLRGKFSFLHTFKKNVRNHLGYPNVEIVLFMPELFATEYEKNKYELNDVDASSKEIIKFIEQNSLPLVGERSHRNVHTYEGKFPLVVVYYDVDFSFDHRTQTQLIRKEVAKVAKDFKGKVTFAISNENAYEEELKSLNLDDSGEDVNAAYFVSQKVMYRMEPVEDFSADELRQFVNDVHAGNIPRNIKSQPVPKSNSGPVLTVVGSTFNELVTENTKDVLIEFYAPWCGHCKKLEPIYKKLGKAFAEHDNIAIAKIDATANDYPPEFDVKGFPSLYYISAKNKQAIKTYDGERELKDLTNFIHEQLSNSKDEL